MTSWLTQLIRPCCRRAGVAACALALLLPQFAMAQSSASEDAVKAAYLYKLRHYVEWPGKRSIDNEPAVVIGLVGAEEVAESLLQMPGAASRPGSRVQVRRLRVGDPIDGVNLLYIGPAYWPRAEAMISQANRQGTLVVSNTEGALAHGSVLNFRYADERVRFEVALDKAERAGIKLSSQLLALALSVTREKRK